MDTGKPPNDIRMVIIVGLFFLCIVGGGIFLALYVILPTSPPWYAVVGMVLVGIPWLVWLVTYLYSCIKIYRNARELESNAGRIFPKASMSRTNMSQISRSNASTSDGTQSPSQNSPNGNSPHVRFGGVVLLGESNNQEKEDRDSYDEDNDNRKNDASRARDNLNKGRESEIPLKSSVPS